MFRITRSTYIQLFKTNDFSFICYVSFPGNLVTIPSHSIEVNNLKYNTNFILLLILFTLHYYFYFNIDVRNKRRTYSCKINVFNNYYWNISFEIIKFSLLGNVIIRIDYQVKFPTLITYNNLIRSQSFNFPRWLPKNVRGCVPKFREIQLQFERGIFLSSSTY